MNLTFNTTRRAEFSETDLAGVMHFSNYFRWMEIAEHEMFRSIGLSVVQPDGDRVISWPRIKVSCEYRGPIRFEDEVAIRLTITRMGSKSIAYEAAFERDGHRLADGHVVMVCCEMRDSHFRSIDIPDEIRRRFETLKSA